MSNYFKKLFVFDLANNHQKSVEHGIKIINEIAEVCMPFKEHGFQFGFKLQYRNLDSLIHPSFKGSDHKQIKRFESTRLTENELFRLKTEIVDKGFIPICTPFDEASVDLIEEHGFEIIKIASCSFTDWPLLERVVKTEKPLILSTAGATEEDIDKVVLFLRNRNKDFALMHCIAEYPTPENKSNFGQVVYLKNRYNCPVGISEHLEEYTTIRSTDYDVYECHVKAAGHGGNDYSKPAWTISDLLNNFVRDLIFEGSREKRYTPSYQELSSLRSLQRGVYLKNSVEKDNWITNEDVFFAMPLQEGQLSANEWSKHVKFGANIDLGKDEPLLKIYLTEVDSREQILDIVKKLVPIIKASGVVIPDKCEMELSHHYGLHNFEKTGVAIFNIINRDYAKKILVMLPNQEHPSHYHKQKEETFNIIYGSLTVNLGDFKKGEMVTIFKGESHNFFTHDEGCVFEEISTTHYPDDSYYTETLNKDRKTKLTFQKRWLTDEVI